MLVDTKGDIDLESSALVKLRPLGKVYARACYEFYSLYNSWRLKNAVGFTTEMNRPWSLLDSLDVCYLELKTALTIDPGLFTCYSVRLAQY